MKLSSLSSKPQLIKLMIDDEETITEHGEAIEFYTWDRTPMDVYMKLADTDMNKSGAHVSLVIQLILDESAKPMVHDDITLPTNLLMKAVAKVVDRLGK